MGQVQAAPAGHLQLAAEGGHSVIDRDRNTGAAQFFGRDKTARSAADHRYGRIFDANDHAVVIHGRT